MTRCLLLVVLSFAPVALAHDPLDSPYDDVVELPLDGVEAVAPPTDVPSPPPVADDGQSAVASDPTRVEGDVPAARSDYELARANAERATVTPDVSGDSDTAASSLSVASVGEGAAPAVAEVPVAPVPAPAGPASTPSAAPASAPVASSPAAPAPEESAPPVLAVPVVAPEPAAAKPPSTRQTGPRAEVWAFHPAPSSDSEAAVAVASSPMKPPSTRRAAEPCEPGCEPAAKREDPVERWRDNPRRVQRTVFGARRHTRGLGAVAGVAYQPSFGGGPAGGALQLAARIGSGFRIGFESRGLWGVGGPSEARLVSSGFLLGATFNTRQLVHPTLDVVFGAGLVRDARGDVVGAVGTTVVRGGAELNLLKNVRLGATLGWGGVSSPEPAIRHDLSGLEAGFALRFGWF